jgi:two-component system chemotaxis response regulator CheY
MNESDKDTKDIRILVVDDFSGMRNILRHTLNLIGYDNVVEARNAQDALLKLSEENYQLIISDWTMPQMSGLEFLQALQADCRFYTVPFLMITAKAERDSVIAAAEAGVAHYMIKPFTAEALQEKIDAIFQKRMS